MSVGLPPTATIVELTTASPTFGENIKSIDYIAAKIAQYRLLPRYVWSSWLQLDSMNSSVGYIFPHWTIPCNRLCRQQRKLSYYKLRIPNVFASWTLEPLEDRRTDLVNWAPNLQTSL